MTMTTPRQARITGSKQINAETRLLDLELGNGEQLNFTGGQFLIVSTNVTLPEGKTAKRSYSILSSDAEQTKFQIAVKKVGEGPGSNYMHHTEPGSEITFSGPWGKFLMDDQTPKETLVLATDTGITAALGLLQNSKLRSNGVKTSLVWMVESLDYFLPDYFIREKIPSDTDWFVHVIPAVNHSERISKAGSVFQELINRIKPQAAYLSGDGALLYPFKDELLRSGVQEDRIKVECFFNNPFKKVSA